MEENVLEKMKANYMYMVLSKWVSIWSPGENYVGNSGSKPKIKFHVLNSASQMTNSEGKSRDVSATTFLLNESPVKRAIISLLFGV